MFNFLRREISFVDWADYKARIDFQDEFYFQQRTRQQNIKNI
jgi:hypothetical protein